jgi:hypothetical protein
MGNASTPQDRTGAAEPSVRVEDGRICVRVPMKLKRRSGRKEILFETPGDLDKAVNPNVQRPLVVAMARGHAWLEALEDGRWASVAEVAEAVGHDPSYVRRLLNLTLLSPDMVERVLDGLEGDEDALDRLARGPGVVWVVRRDSCCESRH